MLSELSGKLGIWQHRLEGHFTKLRESRRSDSLAVFAIEHGLSTLEREELFTALRGWLALEEPLGKHWVLWTIYATELGYDYDGQEYWQSFEKRTPGWGQDIGRRRVLRNYFARFHRTYDGFEPSGPWATQFSIIAWPITHALLPRDLQVQLARMLYEQRHEVAQFADVPPMELGRLVRSHGYGRSSRLTNFLQQEELVGRIVHGLLTPDDSSTGRALSEETLKRLVADLEVNRDGKVWLAETRRAVQRIRLRGGVVGRPAATQQLPAKPSSPEAAQRSIRPQLLLRRVATDDYIAVLELASFSGLAGLNAKFAAYLRQNRCNVPSTGAAWHPRGWLLESRQQKKLVKWPDPKKAVVRFETFDGGLQHLVQSECRISDGPTWLFRLNKDGTATELIGKSARPGHSYVLVQTGEDRQLSGDFRRVRLDCAAAYANEFQLPTVVPDSLVHSLGALGITVEKGLQVWPVGVPAARWDGENALEWLAGDDLCLGISQTGGFDELLGHLSGGGEPVRLALRQGQPTYIGLGKLQPGVYSLKLRARRRSTDGISSLSSGSAQADLNILVRPARRWVPGTTGHVGLIVNTQPHEPSLDALLDARVSLHVAGPEGGQVVCSVRLLRSDGVTLANIRIGTVTLPMRAGDWETLLENRTAVQEGVEKVVAASDAELVLDGGELGCVRVHLSRTASPIQWETKRLGTGIALHVVDDTGQDEPLKVCFASFASPTTFETVPIERSQGWLVPAGKGGVYKAVSSDHEAAIVLSEPGRVTSLDALADVPELGGTLPDGNAVTTLLGHLETWSFAKIAGPLAAQRRALAMRAIRDQLIATMCWPAWLEAERHFRVQGDAERAVAALLQAVDRHVSLALAIQQEHAQLVTESIEDSRQAFFGIAIRFKVCGDERVCEAALRLAMAPQWFREWAGDRTLRLLDELAEKPVLVRAARLAALLGGGEASRVAEGWRLP